MSAVILDGLQLVSFTGSGARELSVLQRRIADWIDVVRTGTSWTDLRGSVQEGLSLSALTAQEVPNSSDVVFKCFRHDQDDDLSMIFQFPHQWDGTSVYPHLHIMPLAAGAGDIAFTWKYAWLPVGGKLDGYSTPQTVTTSVTADDMYRHIVVGLGEVAPSMGRGSTSDHLVVHVYRDASEDSYTTSKAWGTAAANVAALDVDVHHRRYLFGSREQFR